MGIMSWLFGKSNPGNKLPGLIWMYQQFMEAYFIEIADQKYHSYKTLIVFVHFEDDAVRVRELLTSSQIDFLFWNVPRSSIDAYKEVRDCAESVLIVDTSQLPDWSLNVSEETHDSDSVPFVVWHNYPIPRNDLRVQHFLAALPCSFKGHVLTSLDSPLMSLFGGPRTIDMLKQLGMREDENVSATLVDRQIAKAQLKMQKKFDNRRTQEKPASSASEWILLNIDTE